MCTTHWAERDYGLSARQHAVLPEGKGAPVKVDILFSTSGELKRKKTIANKHQWAVNLSWQQWL